MWFTEFGSSSRIGRISLPPSGTSLFAATLPSSRSVQVGKPATSFATIINAGAVATDCGIAPVSPLPATFAFQTINASNAVTGTPNTRVPIAAGGAQTFVLLFSANAPYAPTNVVLGYSCAGAIPATSITGVNTLQLTFDANPVPDMIALGLTLSNDGFARTGGPNGTGLFVVATANVGIAGALTARVRLFDGTTPVTATICETDPVTSICKAPASRASSLPTRTRHGRLPAGDRTYPRRSRALPCAVEYVDPFGIVRGSTSIAVTTQ